MQGCVCVPGYVVERGFEGSDSINCRQLGATNLYYLILASAILLILFPLIAVLAWPRLRAHWANLKDRWSKYGAPGMSSSIPVRFKMSEVMACRAVVTDSVELNCRLAINILKRSFVKARQQGLVLPCNL